MIDRSADAATANARLIAFYLPQFHPIPENDEWWGKGFTEWTNVANARPLFRGHCQPNVPADLGFYDLRLPEARIAQAEMARGYGIEGFCYWHYWFNGKRLLERPLDEVLKSGEPHFPFCLGWANDSWTGIWHGCPDRVLMEQTYPGPRDEEDHFNALLPAFTDPRYITVDGRPLLLIYKPYRLPESKRFIDHWQKLAIKAGLKGIYFVANVNSMQWPAKEAGFDALVPHNPGITTHYYFNSPPTFADKLFHRFTGKTVKELTRHFFPRVDAMPYEQYIRKALPELPQALDSFPCVVPNWDNTPRCGVKGYVLEGSSPELFKRHLGDAVRQLEGRDYDKKVIFLKSWNEWAEGNYLEPDLRFGRRYLEVCREVVCLNGC
ncbi:glycoside hydrolase family 99-like domain-containing protein [Geobacter sp. DSM 9736]|uniref:glycosyltransferase WbsX family protein n=1 Tax=Geobacter sp. DSM 9736 TaxID=1277350 RepID=UPI000B506D2D|nr:glycoside hydrolase family 99-like domain-containing protein [Geobacter sp. DSM 9736]SNB46617.1 Glycosyltransferase WbsX [Geobacter sp. DSM 9736]